MKIFYCSQCHSMEIVSGSVIEVQHHHYSGGIGITRPPIWVRDRLMEIDPSDPMTPPIKKLIAEHYVSKIREEVEADYTDRYKALSKRLNEEIAEKALKKIEFKENGVYMVLVDPSRIDLDALATLDMSNFPVFNVVFIPVRPIPGKELEEAVIIKETVEDITDWLGKTMKCKILLLPTDEDSNET